ncbi:MAG: hypothetical protein NW224_28080 [Leptolyngbyaceae cyanobacterium bins.302]|nr:hypothetical protein [Leptolyngbyaceae cyanobacterium bins.302]
MKGNQVKIGTTYSTKVAKQVVEVQILRRHRSGGWEAKNLATGKIMHIRTADRLSSIETMNELVQDSAKEVESTPVVIEAVKAVEASEKQQAIKRSKEVYIAPQSAIATYKPGDDILKLAELLSGGVTKAQICQHFGWKSWNPHKSAVLKLGYGIRSDAEGKFWLVQNNVSAA